MSQQWFPYPGTMTTFLPGRWLATVETTTGRLVVEPLHLTEEGWYHDSGKKLKPFEKVVAVGHMPDPYQG